MRTARSTLLVMIVACAAGCNPLLGIDEIRLADGGGADAGGADAGDADAGAVDAGVCDPSARFREPKPLFDSGDAWWRGNWHGARLSPDERLLYMSGSFPGDTSFNLFVSARSPQGTFGEPVRLSLSSSTINDFFPTVSSDRRTIVFDSERGGSRRLYVATGAAPDQFDPAAPLGAIAAPGSDETDIAPFLTADGQELWFASDRAGTLGSLDLFRATRTDSGFAQLVHERGLSSGERDSAPVLSADRLTIYFYSTRYGGNAVWTARRSHVDDSFSQPTLVSDVSSPAFDYPGWLSADGCRLYLASARNGRFTVYVAERDP
jgi:hypothetical protein